MQATGAVREFELTVGRTQWEIAPGTTVDAYAYNGQVPGPELRVSEGDTVRVTVKNELEEPTTVHWHGVEVPVGVDGVPNLSQEPIAPGGSFGGTFSFKLDLTPPPVGGFGFSPPDPSIFDTVQFFNFSSDPAKVGFKSADWVLGDGTSAASPTLPLVRCGQGRSHGQPSPARDPYAVELATRGQCAVAPSNLRSVGRWCLAAVLHQRRRLPPPPPSSCASPALMTRAWSSRSSRPPAIRRALSPEHQYAPRCITMAGPKHSSMPARLAQEDADDEQHEPGDRAHGLLLVQHLRRTSHG